MVAAEKDRWVASSIASSHSISVQLPSAFLRIGFLSRSGAGEEAGEEAVVLAGAARDRDLRCKAGRGKRVEPPETILSGVPKL